VNSQSESYEGSTQWQLLPGDDGKINLKEMEAGKILSTVQPSSCGRMALWLAHCRVRWARHIGGLPGPQPFLTLWAVIGKEEEQAYLHNLTWVLLDAR